MTKSNNTPIKRTQRDYSLGFKLQVVDAVEKGDMTYKQAQKIYGIQGRSTVLTWLRKHGKMDWTQSPKMTMPKSPKAKESPAQKIKRLERELEDEHLRNLLLNEVVNILDAEHGTNLRKKYIGQGARSLQKQKIVSLERACKLLGITRQAIYQRESRAKLRAIELAPVKAMVLEIRRFMPRLGGRKLYFLLKPKLIEQGISLGRDAFFSYLKSEHLLVKPKRSYTKTTFSKHWMKKHPNLLKDRQPSRPEEVFVSDITYVQSTQGVHYLSLVTDAYSRKIMGYELSDEMKATDVVKALDMTIANRQYQCSTIHHSDRGLQYCSRVYQVKLNENGITPSMTDGYDCYQNALAERINGILKQEFLLYKCQNLKELRELVEESIVIYNEMRPHLSLGMETPNQVHKKDQEQKLLAFN
ncbi:IS3 family transposase [Pseudoalteromonas sp. MB41]|uniref:IS3 family transposase n=8 Tax=Pseudoalteromonas sp. MB41 TaxID=2896366 RepID=UPI001E301929|nr:MULTISPECIES: IS3 family transposase [unclassified Pseudoalteromonas]MCC9663227.1 IS3 family transposase [Pseudoalteromonas sp. MB41]